LLGYGIRLHQQGDLPSAAECYQKILMQQPNYPEALNFYGVLTHQQGNSATGLELIGKAIQLAPDYFDAYANAGRILMELERFQRAEECYAKAVELRPDSLNAQRGLSSARQQVQYSRERLVICKEELEAHSDDPSAHYQYGLECRGQNQLELAEQAFLRAIELDPQAREAYYQLSRVYYGQDNEAKMLQTLKKWLDNLPGDPSVQYMYLAMTGENTPARASDEYVQESFDKFAASFDQVLQSVDYRAPGLIGQAVAQLALETGQFHQALDAGCGTGLCGPLLRPHVSRLSGVDLSQKMLDKSISRASYDELVQGELTAFIAAHEAYYDLIVSADTLVYFGDLKPVMEAAYKALLPGGGLIFTVEKLDGPGTRQYQLNPHGRYSHSTDYVAEILAGVGFDIRFIAVAVLRFEGGKSVPGLLVSAGKPGFSAGA
jgi:predicted TPR repeat methyltransferase